MASHALRHLRSRIQPSIIISPASVARDFSSSSSASGPKVAVSVSRKTKVNSALKRNVKGKVKRNSSAGAVAIDLKSIPGVAQEPISLDHLPYLDPSTLASEGAVGKLMRFQPELLRDISLWGYPTGIAKNSMPFTVPRLFTLDLADKLHHAKGESSEKSKWLLNGPSGNGKSYLLLQLTMHAMQTGWITMYIPKAYRHVNSLYPYHYSAKTKTFHQPSLSSSLLSNLLNAKANYALLDKIRLPKDYTFTPDLPSGGSASSKRLARDVDFRIMGGTPGKPRTLRDLVELGVKDERISVEVFDTVLDIIANQQNVPFLLTMDVAQAYFGRSQYNTPEGSPLESYHLSTPRTLLDYISGRKHFTNGAAILATSPTYTDMPITPSFLHGLGIATEAKPADTIGAAGGPYTPRFYPSDPHSSLQRWHVENAEELQVISMTEGMTLREAAGLWETRILRRSLHTTNSDEHFTMKYVESGGNPREIYRGINYSFQ